MTFDLLVLDPYHVSPDTSKTYSVAGYSEVMPKIFKVFRGCRGGSLWSSCQN